MKSREMFVRFFGATTDTSSDERKVVEHVANAGTKIDSAESLMAFNRHILGSCEAIDLISQTPVVLDAKEDGAVKTEDEPDENEDANFDLSDIPGIDEAEPGLEADDPAEDDVSTDTDEGEDDPPSPPGDQGNEEGQTGNEDEGAPSGDEGTDPSGDGSVATDNSTQPEAKPENIDDSDEGEIPFIVPPEGSETIGSVLLREELDQFITDILVNPPKKLSPQAISALTTLQRNWIHILGVETIVRILDKLIALPDRLKTIIPTHGENS